MATPFNYNFLGYSTRGLHANPFQRGCAQSQCKPSFKRGLCATACNSPFTRVAHNPQSPFQRCCIQASWNFPFRSGSAQPPIQPIFQGSCVQTLCKLPSKGVVHNPCASPISEGVCATPYFRGVTCNPCSYTFQKAVACNPHFREGCCNPFTNTLQPQEVVCNPHFVTVGQSPFQFLENLMSDMCTGLFRYIFLSKMLICNRKL